MTDHVYTLAEIRNGTGFPRDIRFVERTPLHASALALLEALEQIAEWGRDGLMTDIGFRAEATTVARAAIRAAKGGN